MSDNASKECDWNDEEKNSEDELSNYDSDNDLDCLKNNDSENDDIQIYSDMSDEILANYIKETDLGSLKLKQGRQTFDNVDHFRKIVKEYAIQEYFSLKRIKNEKTRVIIKCGRFDECPWRIHASLIAIDHVTYQIKTCNPIHTCQPFVVQIG